MHKEDFLRELRNKLSGLPQAEIEERVMFYDEMIGDRMEEGLSEEEAVSAIGNVDEIILQIVSETPLTTLVKESVKPKRSMRAWEILLLVLGAPLWLSLLIAVFAVILAVYAVIWSILISLWAVNVSFMACALGGIAAAALLLLRGNVLLAIALFGASLFFAGLSVLLFFGCKGITRGVLLLTKKMALGLKSLFVGKEDVK